MQQNFLQVKGDKILEGITTSSIFGEHGKRALSPRKGGDRMGKDKKKRK